MSTQTILAIIFNCTMIAVFAFAIWRGGRPERIGVLIHSAGFTLTIACRLLSAGLAWSPGHGLILLIDIGVAAAFLWLGATTIRFWPIWAAGFAVSNLFMSLLGGLLPSVPLFAYHTQLGVYAYLALGALALGTYRLPRDAAPPLRNGFRSTWRHHLTEAS